jgi:sugar phosphate isomerase/epimerase
VTRAIGLSAQTITGIVPARLVELARIGGFDRVGLGIDPAAWTAADVAQVRRALADEGVALQDVEVIRLDDRVTDDMRRQIDLAAELDAGWIITVSFNDDADATAALLAELVGHAAGTGVMPILEFGRFTSVGSVEAALDIATRAGCPVLADPLHLARGGGTAASIAACPPGMLPYAQLCDAGPPPAATDRPTLLTEAREHRRDIGEGVLDLRGFVAALPPETCLMNEVRSTALTHAFTDPAAHARHLGATMRRWLAEAHL